MAKISPVSAKYIISAATTIEGVVDKPDVIGAVFGQTEGLLGSELELRELQRSGKIGRIEVNTDIRGGKSVGKIIIPSSLDKAETAIIAAALETIERIGPCNAKIVIEHIEDVRINKREFIMKRAKDLLRKMMENVMPDSQELADEVTYSVRTMEITEYGKDKLPAGPAIDESDEVIIVEGRADVLALLKQGFKNAIALNGTSVPQTVIDLCGKKTVTAFVDGDRGGVLILKELLSVAEIDYVTTAPDGKEVEELTKKEIHKGLRSRITAEQAKLDIGNSTNDEFHTMFKSGVKNTMNINNGEDDSGESSDDQQESQSSQGSQGTQSRGARRPYGQNNFNRGRTPYQQNSSYQRRPYGQQSYGQQSENREEGTATAAYKKPLPEEQKEKFKELIKDLVGTKGAYLLDDNLNVLGKVPVTELQSTLRSLRTGIKAILLDGEVDMELVNTAERAKVQAIVGSDVKATSRRLAVVRTDEL